MAVSQLFANAKLRRLVVPPESRASESPLSVMGHAAAEGRSAPASLHRLASAAQVYGVFNVGHNTPRVQYGRPRLSLGAYRIRRAHCLDHSSFAVWLVGMIGWTVGLWGTDGALVA
ncbi:hypothetical protein L227DRAFT_214100 [Lentinus tigrinus ALCF2SS1-6]|uniref:Uncharacterized protein n=1 Tax=Lentinus tigrinus ALCF2SS1-6 TaxID=1328759 RepID=A0A5C2SQ88_9APHY|nr:hypothetical protein L227DRAFT_214100 [Lentinus tigrinus ALCF2SS1-6]